MSKLIQNHYILLKTIQNLNDWIYVEADKKSPYLESENLIILEFGSLVHLIFSAKNLDRPSQFSKMPVTSTSKLKANKNFLQCLEIMIPSLKQDFPS